VRLGLLGGGGLTDVMIVMALVHDCRGRGQQGRPDVVERRARSPPPPQMFYSASVIPFCGRTLATVSEKCLSWT
jgi:hypothetical protein